MNEILELEEQLTCKIKFAVLICGLFTLQWILL